MKNSDMIEQLRSELRQDLHFIWLDYRKNREMTDRIEKSSTYDEYQFAALGYTIHNLYNSFKPYFLLPTSMQRGLWKRSSRFMNSLISF